MIEIFNYKEINHGIMAANFCIRVKRWENFCIYNLIFFQNTESKTKWISLPCQKGERQGRLKFYPTCGFEDIGITDDFKNEIMKALQEYIAQMEVS